MDDFLIIGKITRIHGVKGEVKVLPLTDDLKRFKKLNSVYIDKEEIKVIGVKLQPNKVIMQFEGIDSVEKAERLKNKEIEIKREDAVELEKGVYFVADLIDCEVLDESNKLIGILNDVIFTGSNEVYVVGGEKEILVPAIKDVVINVDIEAKKVIVKDLEKWS
ncbi:ribosome maturation factor RimM [Clostridium sp. DL1XJH146]